MDGGIQTAQSRHKPTIIFQRSQEASWPAIVQTRVTEFFQGCVSINRGPFTSQFGMDTNALISAQEIINGVRVQPKGIIRDSYNHLVGIGYGIAKSSAIIAVPIADDGSIFQIKNVFLDWDDFEAPPVDAVLFFYRFNIRGVFPQYKGYVPKYIQKTRDTQRIIGVTLANGFSIPASDPKDPKAISDMRIVEVDDLEWDINRTIAYDDTLRKKAFKNAEEPYEDKGHIELKASSLQDDIEDIYQHLRLTFSNWLAMAGAGRDIREALRGVLKSSLPLYEKRKRLDILLENKVTRWLEPSEDDESIGTTGFLRVDCRSQNESDCSGRCKWVSESNTCKIHTPASIQPNGVAIQVPRLLYLRLVDELIRYASRRDEIFRKEVPRLTIRKEAMRQGDQFIIPEGSPDWNSWWELLRTEWMTPEKEEPKFFDEQYEPTPSGLPTNDTRILPASIASALGADDPKVTQLVWNPTPTPDRPYFFLKSILRNHPILAKTDTKLSTEELDEIVRIANVIIIYMGSGVMLGARIRKTIGAVEAIIIATVDGTVGWISEHGKYSVKLPLVALPDILNEKRLQIGPRTVKQPAAPLPPVKARVVQAPVEQATEEQVAESESPVEEVTESEVPVEQVAEGKEDEAPVEQVAEGKEDEAPVEQVAEGKEDEGETPVEEEAEGKEDEGETPVEQLAPPLRATVAPTPAPLRATVAPTPAPLPPATVAPGPLRATVAPAPLLPTTVAPAPLLPTTVAPAPLRATVAPAPLRATVAPATAAPASLMPLPAIPAVKPTVPPPSAPPPMDAAAAAARRRIAASAKP